MPRSRSASRAATVSISNIVVLIVAANRLQKDGEWSVGAVGTPISHWSPHRARQTFRSRSAPASADSTRTQKASRVRILTSPILGFRTARGHSCRWHSVEQLARGGSLPIAANQVKTNLSQCERAGNRRSIGALSKERHLGGESPLNEAVQTPFLAGRLSAGPAWQQGVLAVLGRLGGGEASASRWHSASRDWTSATNCRSSKDATSSGASGRPY